MIILDLRIPNFLILRYGDQSDRSDESGCPFCPAGKYCEVPGLTDTDLSGSNRQIGAGHYSNGGAKVKYPVETAYQNGSISYPDCLDSYECGLCSEGHLCNNEGNTIPNQNPCPQNTYSNKKGLKTFCLACPPGLLYF